jgi:hypothetical protein
MPEEYTAGMKTIGYWRMVAGRFASWVWGHLLESASLGIAVILVGILIQYWLSGQWPSLKQSEEQVMASLSQLLIFGLLAVLGVAGICAVIGIVFFPPQLHSEQLLALTAARNDLKAAQDASMPSLTGEIEAFTCGQLVHPDISKSPYIVFRVMVRNTGAPSIADDWTLIIRRADGKAFQGLPIMVEDGHRGPVISTADKNHVVQRALSHMTVDKLLSKQHTVPIPAGGANLGWAPFVFPGLPLDIFENEEINGTNFFLEFSDIHKRRILCTAMPGLRNLDDLPVGFGPMPL